MQQPKTYRLKGIVNLLICDAVCGKSINDLKRQLKAPTDEIQAALRELVKEGAIQKAGKGNYKKASV